MQINLTCSDGRSKLSCNETFIGMYKTSNKKLSVKIADILKIEIGGDKISVIGDEFVQPSDFPWYIVYICAGVVGVIILIVLISCIASCIRRKH